jgi:hypothetical protein
MQIFQEGHGMSENSPKTHPLNTTPSPEASVAPPPQESGRVGLSKTRLVLAFLVAATSDILSYSTVFVPPVQWAVDLATALLLFMILG